MRYLILRGSSLLWGCMLKHTTYILIILLILLILSIRGYYAMSSTGPSLKNGDIVFIKSETSQSIALKEATGSEWTHVGIFVEGYVAEAVAGVRYTSLKSFIGRSKNGEYIIYRYPGFSSSLKELKAAINKYQSPYDIYFEWDNTRIYCSELVYKVFKDLSGVDIGKLQTLKEMDLSGPAVRDLIKRRYDKNNKKVNLDETIVTPVSQMLDSDLELVTTSSF